MAEGALDNILMCDSSAGDVDMPCDREYQSHDSKRQHMFLFSNITN